MTITTEAPGTRPAKNNVIYGELARERGRRVGASWATEAAEYVELKRLAAVAVHLRFDDEQVGYQVVRAIIGEQVLSEPEVREFRETIGIGDDDSEAESRDYWQGFVEGGLDVFQKIEL